MAITDSIKAILTVQIKPRNDSYSDQYSRIFMVKIMMVGALLVGLNWYNDKMTCIVPGSLGISEGYVSQACWVNGLYIYQDLLYQNDEVGSYGIPRDIKMNGKYADGTICATHNPSFKRNEDCEPMKKTFYIQYQYLTFVLAALGIVYYAPYAFFRLNNQDMTSLKGSVQDCNVNGIVNNYFNYKINPKVKLRFRVFGNIIIKATYILSNVTAFLILDSMLNGAYAKFGINWITWSKQPNHLALDYIGERTSPKPGNFLLPSFGFCEVKESAKDIKNFITNNHKLVCELSQHVLYQYMLLVTWFTMIFGIVISSFGLIYTLADYGITITCLFFKEGPKGRKLCKRLTLRECEYLEFIRKKNLPLYGAVLHRLKIVQENNPQLKINDEIV